MAIDSVERTIGAPQGLAAAMPSPDLGAVSSEPTGDGGVEVTFDPNAEAQSTAEAGEHFDNLAETLDDSLLANIATKVIEGFNADLASRDDWENTLLRGLDLLGLRLDQSNIPFEGACTAVHPLIIENCVKFQAKAIQEIFPPTGPVRTQIVGDQSDDVIAQAQRVGEYMNYQLTEEMPDYFDDTERLLFYLAYAGIAFRKIWYDADTESIRAEFVKATDFVVSNYAQDLRRAERYTHRILMSENDLHRMQDAKAYRDVDCGQPQIPERSEFDQKLDRVQGVNQNETPDRTPVYTLLEQHCYLSDESLGDGKVALPYIVTVEKNSQQVLAIRRNWNEQDEKKRKLIWFVKYQFVPSDNFYSLGFIHLIGNLTRTVTLTMRNLVDSGQFANLQGGFKTKGMKIVGNNQPVAPGEFRDVEVQGAAKLADCIVPFQFKEPSKTLFDMMSFLVAAGQKFADSADQVVADSTNYGPVGTTLALLDASAKFFSSIHKRLHKSLRDEFRLFADLNANILPNAYPYSVSGAQKEIKKLDFNNRVQILPVSDPNIHSNAQRAALANLIIQGSQQAPEIHNKREAYRRAYQAMNIQDIDKVLPPPPSAQPGDPISELMAAVKGMPISAFPQQDHQSHIAVKSAWLNDPVNGGNPMMARTAPVIQANIQEHMVMQYQQQMQGLINQASNGQQVPPQVLNQLAAKAAQQIQSANAVMAAGGPQSPEMMMAQVAMEEAKIKKMSLEHTIQKDNSTTVLQQKELRLEQGKEIINALLEAAKIMAGQDQAKAQHFMDLAKHLSAQTHDKDQQDAEAVVRSGEAHLQANTQKEVANISANAALRRAAKSKGV